MMTDINRPRTHPTLSHVFSINPKTKRITKIIVPGGAKAIKPASNRTKMRFAFFRTLELKG